MEALTPAAQQGMEDESTDGAGDQADHENVDAVKEICGRDSRAHQVDHHVGFRGEECEVTFCDECDKCFHLTDPFSDGVYGVRGRLPCGPNLYLRRWMQVAHQVSKGSPATRTIECIASPCPHHFLPACSEMLP